MFIISGNAESCRDLEKYYFNTEGDDTISPQYILATYPEVLLSTGEFQQAIHVLGVM